MSTSRYSVLETRSSEVTHKTIFTNKFTIYIPDFFFILNFIFIFLTSTIVDGLFIFYSLFYGNNVLFTFFYSITIVVSTILWLFMILYEPDCEWRLKKKQFVHFLFNVFQLEALLLGVKALKTLNQRNNNIYLPRFAFSVFNMSVDSLATLKVYCFLHSVVKSTPQLYITSLYLLVTRLNLQNITGIICLFNIFLNSVIISLTVSSLFPIRKTPRVFTCVTALLLNAMVKFMATMASSCLVLTIFSQTFKSVGFYALIIQGCRLIPAVCTFYISTNTDSNLYQDTIFNFYVGPMFCVVYTFIYIHPFEGQGKLLYYVVYLSKYLMDMFFLYVFTPAEPTYTLLLYSLTTVIAGFVSLFGLINVMQKSTKMSIKQFTELNEEEQNGKLVTF